MPVEIGAGPVIAHRRPGISVPGSDLDIAQVHPGIQLVESNVATMLNGSACDRAGAAPVLAALLNVALAATYRHLLQPDQITHPGTRRNWLLTSQVMGGA
jgi:hypothetical protein